MLAPEILALIKHKKTTIDERKADVWALGMTIFQSVMLKTPYLGKYASKVDPMFCHFYEGTETKFWKQQEIS